MSNNLMIQSIIKKIDFWVFKKNIYVYRCVCVCVCVHEAVNIKEITNHTWWRWQCHIIKFIRFRTIALI